MASIWNCTWTRGMPAGIGGMPRSLKRASERLSATSSRSPCSTWMSTAVWLSTPVVNISLPVAGIVELRRMIFDTTPPIVSMPSESGVTSSSSMSRLPVTRMSACTAAPSATTSSGFSSLCGVRPNSSPTGWRTSGMRVEPPTSTTSSICDGCEAGVGQRLTARPERPLDDRRDQALELGARQMALVGRRLESAPPTTMSVSSRSDRSHFAWMTALRISWTASGVARVGGPEGPPTVSEDLVQDRVHQQHVDVVAAEVGVAVGREHLEDAVLDLRIEMSNVPPPRS